MSLIETKPELHDALEQFEACLESPLVPGELVAWSGSLHDACDKTTAHWLQEVETVHVAQFKEIKRQDMEMASRVDDMKAEDDAITCQIDAVCHDVTKFHERSETMEADEGRFEEIRKELVKKGLDLVIRIRTQQQTIRTWYLEAFDRDRGTGD